MDLASLFKPALVGLDIGTSGIKAVELTGRKAPRLAGYNRVPLPLDAMSPEGEMRDRKMIVQALKKLFDSGVFSTRRVALGAFGNSVITRRITVSKMRPSELRHQLYWEAEQYIPFNVDEVNLDFAILGSPAQGANPAQMDVLLVAAKKEYISSLMGVARDAGLDPAIVDIQAFALGNSFEFNYAHLYDSATIGASNMIIDFGAGSTKISVVEGDKTTFTRELRKSGLACTQMLSEGLGVPIDQAERIKITEFNAPEVKEIIDNFNRQLVDEITRTVDFYLSQGSDRGVQGIYYCGGASRTAGMIESLTQASPAPFQPLNPVQNIAGSGKGMSAEAIKEVSYLGAVAVGLALRKAGDAK